MRAVNSYLIELKTTRRAHGFSDVAENVEKGKTVMSLRLLQKCPVNFES